MCFSVKITVTVIINVDTSCDVNYRILRHKYTLSFGENKNKTAIQHLIKVIACKYLLGQSIS